MPRLDILLARNLGLSRSVVTRLLRSGRVHDPAGHGIDDGKQQIDPARLPITVMVDGSAHELLARSELLLHKPVGTVTALRDDRHPTAYALVKDAPLAAELRAVGRLDLDSSGLLLWTTDGTLLHRLTHPRWGIERAYQVALASQWSTPGDDLVLSDGHKPHIVALDELAEADAHPGLVAAPGARRLATITLASGRFHEVRRIFAELGALVLSLCRVRYGDVVLPRDLAPGAWLPIDLRARFRGITPAPGDDRS